LLNGTAALLRDGFRNRTHDWQDLDWARQEVLESLNEGRISRVAVDESTSVVGWIGGIPMYSGHVWEIHPLVVAAQHRRQGVGRALIRDLENIVRRKGALTLWAGSDDENNETSLSAVDLYADLPSAIRNVRNFKGHPYEFYIRVGFKIVGLMPDANGVGKPDIFLAKRVTNTG
jgi:aminoglycoside 6'-N-acetyltransferase I